MYIDRSIAALREMHKEVLQTDRSQLTIRQFLEHQCQNILKAHSIGNSAVTFHLSCWCTDMIGKASAEILAAELTPDQARQTISAEYGFGNWEEVQALGDTPFDLDFEDAVDQLLSGDLPGLGKSLQQHPELCQQQSQFPHRATLLHYIAANGVESHRQVTPLNAADITQCLIDAGADVNAEANMYGGGSTTLGLLLSSVHPAKAGVVDKVAEVLQKMGAR